MSVKASILFVDDEQHIVETLKSLFRNIYNVFTATSGSEALGIIKNNQIHAIISDQRMPEMEGIDLLREVKKLAPNTVRIMLTGYSDLAAIIGSINEGEIYRYIYKPWNNKDLRNTVSQAAEVGLRLAAEFPIAQDSDESIAENIKAAKTGILVINDDHNTFLIVKEMFKEKYDVVFARNYETAIDIMASQPVGIVISDVVVNKEDITGLIKVLKSEHPSLVTVVLTAFKDANMTIGLINQGQIFRFLTKPIHRGQLRASVEASVVYHHKCKKHPILLSKHRVEKAEASANPTIASNIMNRLKSLQFSITAQRSR